MIWLIAFIVVETSTLFSMMFCGFIKVRVDDDDPFSIQLIMFYAKIPAFSTLAQIPVNKV